jgi:diaminopimelate epimerase
MHFYKFQALGNDFLITRESSLGAFAGKLEDFARGICDRHFGAGADGLEVLLDSSTIAGADFEVRLFNADGGETPISGNGTRCVAAYLYLIEEWKKPSIRIATGAGVKTLKPVEKRENAFVFATEMGKPKLRSEEIPVLLPALLEKVIGQPLDVNGQKFVFTSVSMGNPHCSIFVEDFERIDWRVLGAKIERHENFPERTNVEFIRVVDREAIEVRFWERGCGETLASGTGACAAALASILNEFTGRKVVVRTAAGELVVEWRDDQMVIQTGEASLVYKGEWLKKSRKVWRSPEKSGKVWKGLE